MTDGEIRAYIKQAIDATIAEYKRAGLIKGAEDMAYKDASEMLFGYYASDNKPAEVTYAIQGQRFDPYFRIVPMYFAEGLKIEAIAEAFGVDVSTIVRNKKRLCLAIYYDVM